MPVVFVKNEAGWNELTRSPAGAVYKDINKRGQKLQQLARRQVGKKTGRLAASITSITTVDAKGVINVTGSGSKIALIHHEGAKAHIIRPKRAKMLRFVQNGRVRYANVVHHPGHRSNKYLTGNLPRVILR